MKTEQDKPVGAGGQQSQWAAAPQSLSRIRAQLDALALQRRELDGRLREQLASGDGELGLHAQDQDWFDPDFVNGVYLGERSESPERQLAVLRRFVALDTRNLSLRSQDASQHPGLGIDRLYVPLWTDLALPEAAAVRALTEASTGAAVPFPEADAGAERVPDVDRARALTGIEAIILCRSLEGHGAGADSPRQSDHGQRTGRRGRLGE